MALSIQYPEDFLRLWNAWPKWPAGRSRKQEAYKKFQAAKRELKFTDQDITDLVKLIEQMKLDHERWQPGNSYGPQGLQVWINQRGWLDEYPRKKKQLHTPGAGFHAPEAKPKPRHEELGMTPEAYEQLNKRKADEAFAELKRLGMRRHARNQ